MSQIPRALRQSDLEKALSNFRRVKKGTNEYRLALQSPPWSRNTEPDDEDRVQDAILKISEIMNHIVANNQSESQAQDP